MKSGSAIALVIVVVALLFVAWAFFAPSKSTTVLAPTPTPLTNTTVDTVDLGQVPTGSPSMSPSPSTSTSPSQVAFTVEITDEGFFPAAVTVKSGTTVAFVNHGQGTHWPASDPHPTHGGLPGFDARGALATGDSYTFTFDKLGTWGYHDHLHPNLKGTITVN